MLILIQQLKMLAQKANVEVNVMFKMYFKNHCEHGYRLYIVFDEKINVI